MSKRKKMFWETWWGWVLIIGVFAGVMIGGNQSSSPTEDNKVEKNEFEKNIIQIEQLKTDFLVNESAEIGDYKLTVTEMKRTLGDDTNTPKEDYDYVIVSLTIENVGKNDIAYSPFQFKMTNSEGYDIHTDFIKIDSESPLKFGELSPGKKVSGSLVFEHPKEDLNLHLQFEPNFWSSSPIIVHLNQ